MSALKIMPCPVNAGKHPFRDTRWIVTSDAVVEMSPSVPDDWRLESGSLICEMRDGQEHYAKLFAAAPETIVRLKEAKDSRDSWQAEALNLRRLAGIAAAQRDELLAVVKDMAAGLKGAQVACVTAQACLAEHAMQDSKWDNARDRIYTTKVACHATLERNKAAIARAEKGKS